MIVQGKRIAQSLHASLAAEVSALGRAPALDVLVSQSDKTTEQFVRSKKQVGRKLGIDVRVIRLEQGTTCSLADAVRESVEKSDGVVVQLPLPKSIEHERVFEALPMSHDVDGIGTEAADSFRKGTAAILPPVLGAIHEILSWYNVMVSRKQVLVVGEGRLVGKPAAVWFAREGAAVTVANKKTSDFTKLTMAADVIVLGAGVPGLLQSDMVRSGVVVLDAGTSESGRRVVGDAHPAVGRKASLFTPTPGGIGPVAVTMIFANVLTLIQQRS